MRTDYFAGSLGTADGTNLAPAVADRGFDVMWLSESSNDALATCAGVAAATSGKLGCGTAVSLAFARSPLITAYQAWAASHSSLGTFHLGLGAGSRREIEARFGMPFDRPVERMRDYIACLRALFVAWGSGALGTHQGPFYQVAIDDRRYAPARHDYRPPIYVAAVGPRMTAMAAETADGLILHPLTAMSNLDGPIADTIAVGLADAGRTRSALDIMIPVLAARTDHPEFPRQRDELRRRIKWYAEREQYAPLFAATGLGDWAEHLTARRTAGTPAAPDVVSDEILNEYAVLANASALPAALQERFGGRVDRIAFLYDWLDLGSDEPTLLSALRSPERATDI